MFFDSWFQDLAEIRDGLKDMFGSLPELTEGDRETLAPEQPLDVEGVELE